MRSCVYIIHAMTTPYYKIGRTKNIKDRLHGLRGTVPFFDLDVVAVHYHEKYEEIERRLHSMFADKRLKNTEWFELSSDDLSTVLMRTVDLVDSMGFGNRKGDLHELFPSPQESTPRLDRIEFIKTPDSQIESISKEPSDAALYLLSLYTAAKKLNAEMAREIESALGKEEYDPKWSQALNDYADALDVYTGEYTYSVVF